MQDFQGSVAVVTGATSGDFMLNILQIREPGTSFIDNCRISAATR